MSTAVKTRDWNPNDFSTEHARQHYDNLRINYHDFTWGAVLFVFEVGPYDIVMFTPNCPVNRDPKTFDRSPMFHPYVGGKDTHRSYHSLDEALVGAIASKNCDLNSQAAHFAAKILDIETP